MTAARLVVVAAMVAFAVVASPPAAAQSDATCLGEPVTLVAVVGVATVGTEGDDVILGTEGPDIIDGLGGNDVICGLGGDDIIRGQRGRDRIDGGPGADTLRGGRQGDDLHGGRGADEIWGQRGQDVIDGGRGHDTIRGGRGADAVSGGSGGDTIAGGSGDDTCVGGSGDDTVSSCNEAPPHASRVHAVGDSVMLGATTGFCNRLTAAVPGVVEDAAVSRQFSAAFGLVSTVIDAGVPDDMVFIIGLGSNGPFSAAALDQLVTIDDTSRYLFVNVKEPRPWEASVNATLSAGVQRHAHRAGLVDWHSLASANPSYLGTDGIHLTCTGAGPYAAAIAAGLSSLPPA